MIYVADGKEDRSEHKPGFTIAKHPISGYAIYTDDGYGSGRLINKFDTLDAAVEAAKKLDK